MKLVSDEKGAVAVEFMIVLVFVLMPLFVGLVDAARMINAQVVLDRAAREGAVCIMRGDPYEKAIQNVLTDANFNTGPLVVTTNPAAGKLTLTYTIPNFPLFDTYKVIFREQITSSATYQLP